MRAQLLFDQSKCAGCGKCREACPNGFASCTLCGACVIACPSGARVVCGREYTVETLMRELYKDRVFYEVSGGGVTFSGGECMLQIDFLVAMLKACQEAGISTAVDTAGDVPLSSFEAILPHTDLFLYDVKCLDRKKHMSHVGVDNARILENLKELLAVGKRVWVRIPVIAEFNDTVEEMQAIRGFLASVGMPERVELLPYHAMGAHKYETLGMAMPLYSAPSEEEMERLKRVFA